MAHDAHPDGAQLSFLQSPPLSPEQAIYAEAKAILCRPASLAELRRGRFPSKWVKPKTPAAQFRAIARDLAHEIASLSFPPDPDVDDTELGVIECWQEVIFAIADELGVDIGDLDQGELGAVDHRAAASAAQVHIGCPLGGTYGPGRRDALRQEGKRVARAVLRNRRRLAQETSR